MILQRVFPRALAATALLLALAGNPVTATAQTPGELLEPEKAFRDLVRIRVAVSPRDAARGSVKLKVTSQGCADVGVCYTPLEQMVDVSLPGRGIR